MLQGKEHPLSVEGYASSGSDAESESSQSDYSSHDSDDRLADLTW